MRRAASRSNRACGGIRNLARQGSLRMVVSDMFLKRAAEEGLRVREYAPPAGGVSSVP